MMMEGRPYGGIPYDANSVTGIQQQPSDRQLAGLGYGLGISVLVMLLLTVILSSYFCIRARNVTANPRSAGSGAGPRTTDVEVGVDEATLASYPTVVYSQAKLEEGKEEGTTAACCSICLADYKGADVLRRLPECRHLFHLDCVDPWLRSHPSCPMCRSLPAPSPTPMPLAEIVAEAPP